MVQRAVLCVLDGYGCRAEVMGNAIALAHTPNFDALWSGSAHAELAASGLAVGLPEGQQGNSEVGHLTIGSGRVVLQDLTRIDAAISDGSFFENEVLRAALERSRGTRLHLVGLVSPGGVHSHQDHLVAVAEMAGRVRRIDYEGVSVAAVSPEDLVVVKAVVHREETSRYWFDALSILARTDLDWEYLLWRARVAPARLLSLLVYAVSRGLAVPSEPVERLHAAVFGPGELPLGGR